MVEITISGDNAADVLDVIYGIADIIETNGTPPCVFGPDDVVNEVGGVDDDDARA